MPTSPPPPPSPPSPPPRTSSRNSALSQLHSYVQLNGQTQVEAEKSGSRSLSPVANGTVEDCTLPEANPEVPEVPARPEVIQKTPTPVQTPGTPPLKSPEFPEVPSAPEIIQKSPTPVQTPGTPPLKSPEIEKMTEVKVPQVQVADSAGAKAEEPLVDPWCDPAHPRVIQFQDISAAAFKIKSGIMVTPCTRSHLSSITGTTLFFKKDFLQYTGSFKVNSHAILEHI